MLKKQQPSFTQGRRMMPFSTIAELLKSGKITVFANNIKALEITAADKTIDVNAVNKEFLKQALSASRQKKENKGLRGTIEGTVGQLKTAKSSLDLLKDVAEGLCAAGITVTLSYEGDVVVTMGSGANPKLSSVATGTKAIEINSPRKLIELGL